MATKDWRMVEPCESCPFTDSPGGTRQRNALRPGRMASIKRELLRGGLFQCHKTTNDDGFTEEDEYVANGKEKLCAGAIAFQEEHGATSNYQRVCESLDYFSEKRERKRAAR